MPQYDFVTQYRGSMCLVADGKRTLMLTDWPQSLLDAYKAGVLTGKAAEEAEILLRTGEVTVPRPRRHPISHPWNMALHNYRAAAGMK